MMAKRPLKVPMGGKVRPDADGRRRVMVDCEKCDHPYVQETGNS